MQTLKPIVVLATALFFVQSCGDKPKADNPCHASFEIPATNMRDTVNFTDCDGRKQGKWIPNKINKLATTTYYRNDTVINSQ